MGEMGFLQIVYAFARMLAIGAGVLSGLTVVSILWLCLSELGHKKA